MPKKPKYYVRADGLHEAIRVIDGKRVAFRGQSDSEVEKKMIAYKGEVARGRLFKTVAEEWKDEHFPKLSPTTVLGYQRSYKDALAQFGEVPVKLLTAADIDQYFIGFKRKGYGKKTTATRRIVVNLILNKAVLDGDIQYNPCSTVSIPRGLKQEPRDFPSDEDIAAVKNCANLPGGLLPYFILYSGCRRGEVIALTYGDIDREKKIIRINKAVCYDHNQPKLKTPKTKAGNREIILLDKLAGVLSKGSSSQLIFPGADGNLINESQLRRDWVKWQEASGTSVTAHQLRHGYATMLFEAGIDTKDAQELLGHTTLAMTQGIYTHIRQQRRSETAVKLNALAETF